MTEAEAKTKWCPFVRLTRDDLTPNRSENLADITRCIGSACMAWRSTDNEAGPSAAGGPEPEYKPAGFCGLAGKH